MSGFRFEAGETVILARDVPPVGAGAQVVVMQAIRQRGVNHYQVLDTRLREKVWVDEADLAWVSEDGLARAGDDEVRAFEEGSRE